MYKLLPKNVCKGLSVCKCYENYGFSIPYHLLYVSLITRH